MDSLLIVEDDSSTLTRLVSVFSRKGFRVRGAPNIAQANKLFAEERPNCIIMDLHFPDGHGIEDFYSNALALQEKNGESPCPVVILTASDAEEDIQELLDCGLYTIHSKGDPIDSVETSVRQEIVSQKRGKLKVYHGRGSNQKTAALVNILDKEN